MVRVSLSGLTIKYGTLVSGNAVWRLKSESFCCCCCGCWVEGPVNEPNVDVVGFVPWLPNNPPEPRVLVVAEDVAGWYFAPNPPNPRDEEEVWLLPVPNPPNVDVCCGWLVLVVPNPPKVDDCCAWLLVVPKPPSPDVCCGWLEGVLNMLDVVCPELTVPNVVALCWGWLVLEAPKPPNVLCWGWLVLVPKPEKVLVCWGWLVLAPNPPNPVVCCGWLVAVPPKPDCCWPNVELPNPEEVPVDPNKPVPPLCCCVPDAGAKRDVLLRWCPNIRRSSILWPASKAVESQTVKIGRAFSSHKWFWMRMQPKLAKRWIQSSIVNLVLTGPSGTYQSFNYSQTILVIIMSIVSCFDRHVTATFGNSWWNLRQHGQRQCWCWKDDWAIASEYVGSPIWIWARILPIQLLKPFIQSLSHMLIVVSSMGKHPDTVIIQDYPSRAIRPELSVEKFGNEKRE